MAPKKEFREDIKKEKVVGVRFTPKNLEKIQQLAEESSKTVSAYLRELVLKEISSSEQSDLHETIYYALRFIVERLDGLTEKVGKLENKFETEEVDSVEEEPVVGQKKPLSVVKLDERLSEFFKMDFIGAKSRKKAEKDEETQVIEKEIAKE